MAGGHGTRFWPRSRRHIPKQLLPIGGQRSLLQETVRRLHPLFSADRVLVVTNEAHAAAVRRQLPQLRRQQVLAEPQGRNTLACLALAAEWIKARESEATMVVLPADHVISDPRGFRRSLRDGCELAEGKPALVTFGIRPTRPDPGYGYIEVGDPIHDAAGGAAWVRSFREKPAAALAKRYLKSGRYLWNSGMFVWRTSVFDTALEQHAPLVRATLRGVFGSSATKLAGRLRRAYRQLPSIAVDVAVMEPAASRRAGGPRVAVIAADLGWNDVGSWVAMPELWGCDQDGNATAGKVVPIESGNCIVYTPERLVALVGVKDLIVVDSDDALLICARDRAQDVRRVTDELKRRGWVRYL
jgi:mannose-1-phosphate guanylyltransferase